MEWIYYTMHFSVCFLCAQFMSVYNPPNAEVRESLSVIPGPFLVLCRPKLAAEGLQWAVC